MKEKILEISDKLRNREITEKEARKQFLFLFGVSGSCFWGHKWTKWKQQNIKMQYIRNGITYDGYDTIQTRYCLRCGKLQKEDIAVY